MSMTMHDAFRSEKFPNLSIRWMYFDTPPSHTPSLICAHILQTGRYNDLAIARAGEGQAMSMTMHDNAAAQKAFQLFNKIHFDTRPSPAGSPVIHILQPCVFLDRYCRQGGIDAPT